jgi:hypothetical protein
MIKLISNLSCQGLKIPRALMLIETLGQGVLPYTFSDLLCFQNGDASLPIVISNLCLTDTAASQLAKTVQKVL